METIALKKKRSSSLMMVLIMAATFLFTAAFSTTSVYAEGTLNDLNISVDENGLNTGIEESNSGNVMTDIIAKY